MLRTRRTRGSIRSTGRRRGATASTTSRPSVGSKPSWAAASPSGADGARSNETGRADRRLLAPHLQIPRGRCAMKILRVALAPVLVLIGGVVTVWANPGDSVAVRGILAWPPILANEPFLVLRAHNRRFYYADVTPAEPP